MTLMKCLAFIAANIQEVDYFNTGFYQNKKGR